MAVIPALQRELPLPAPKKGVVLLGDKAEDLSANWYERRTTDAPKWTMENGVFSPTSHKDLTSKQEFGDCYLHVEFKTPAEGGGNAGVGLMGRYEVQIFNSFGKEPESHGAGALYSQKAAKVEASKKPGEWQSYDIIFKAPRLDADGKVLEEARATVFQNGVVVQYDEAFTGMTGIQYEVYPKTAKKGPIVLQGDHDPVQYRNLWVVPMDTPAAP